MTKGVKHPTPFKIKMDADEALERFIRTDPREVEALIKRSKQKKPSGTKKKRKVSDGTSQSDTVVDLRRRRMRKRSTGK
jgi:hypothetical protein